MPIRARAGRVLGRDHLLRAANCQDSHALYHDDLYAVGIVCDGCGEGANSEFGAAAAAYFLSGEAVRLLRMGTPPADLPAALYVRLQEMLGGLLALIAPPNRIAFIRDYLLFTVLGVVVTEGQAVIFAAGDGLIAIDEAVIQRDEGNAPRYPAYHLLDVPHQPADLPSAFDVYPVPAGWRRLAIGSDGFDPALLPQTWGFTNARALQRKMNVWNDQDHRFRDDATLITVEEVQA